MLNDPQDQLDKSHCSTVKVLADKSNYWVPALYFINPNGTYSMLNGEPRIYYLLDFDKSQPLAAFPPGLHMISGLAMRRDPGAKQAQGIQLTVDAYLNVPTNNQFIPNGTVHPDPPGQGYVQLNVRFPNCGWANQSLDSWDHFSHMAWSVNDKGEWDPMGRKCPDTHPIRYPQIFLENFYRLEPWQKDQWNRTGPSVILANGDTTGATFHGDFVNGWEPEVLQRAINECRTAGDDLDKCKAFDGQLQDPWNKTTGAPADMYDCRLQSQIPAEDVGFYRPLEHLPGCNPRWDWDGPTDHRSITEGRDACPWFEGEPGWTSPNLQYWAQREYSFPIVLPGVDSSNVSNLVTSVGRWQGTGARIVPWPTDQDGETPQSVPPNSKGYRGVLVGSQAEVDKAAKTKDDKDWQPSVFGWDSPPGHWEQEKPADSPKPAPVDTKRYEKMAATTHQTATYACATTTAWAGLPCGPEYVKDAPKAKDEEHKKHGAGTRVLPSVACVLSMLLSVAYVLA